MADDKARVLARGSAAVPDFDAMDREPALRRSIGRRYEQLPSGDYGYVPTGAVELVGKRTEIARAIADGDLWPADQATADWAESLTRAGVVFDPTFGKAASPATITTASAKAEKESSS
jgi:hypothetical protein